MSSDKTFSEARVPSLWLDVSSSVICRVLMWRRHCRCYSSNKVNIEQLTYLEVKCVKWRNIPLFVVVIREALHNCPTRRPVGWLDDIDNIAVDRVQDHEKRKRVQLCAWFSTKYWQWNGMVGVRLSKNQIFMTCPSVYFQEQLQHTSSSSAAVRGDFRNLKLCSLRRPCWFLFHKLYVK